MCLSKSGERSCWFMSSVEKSCWLLNSVEISVWLLKFREDFKMDFVLCAKVIFASEL